MQQHFSKITTNNYLIWLKDKALHYNRGRANAGAMPFLSGTPAFFALLSLCQFGSSKLTSCTEWVERHSRGCDNADKMQGMKLSLITNTVQAQTNSN